MKKKLHIRFLNVTYYVLKMFLVFLLKIVYFLYCFLYFLKCFKMKSLFYSSTAILFLLSTRFFSIIN